MEFTQILIVEDNVSDAELAISVLKEQNIVHSIHHVSDGAEALDYLFFTGKYAGANHATPHIILLDVNMPKVHGIDVLKRIKSEEKTKKIPVIMLTSSNEERDIQQAYNNGANSYIVKPVGFEQFAKALQKVGSYWMMVNHSYTV